MIGIPSGYDWYDGSKLDDQINSKTRRPRRSRRDIILEVGGCAS